MPRLALLLLLGLVACSSDTAPGQSRNAMAEGWRTERGAVPTKAEFTAVVASCQDRTKAPGGDLDSCLTDMGLRRSQ